MMKQMSFLTCKLHCEFMVSTASLVKIQFFTLVPLFSCSIFNVVSQNLHNYAIHCMFEYLTKLIQEEKDEEK